MLRFFRRDAQHNSSLKSRASLLRLCKARRIINDPNHPHNGLFPLLRLGRTRPQPRGKGKGRIIFHYDCILYYCMWQINLINYLSSLNVNVSSISNVVQINFVIDICISCKAYLGAEVELQPSCSLPWAHLTVSWCFNQILIREKIKLWLESANQNLMW